MEQGYSSLAGVWLSGGDLIQHSDTGTSPELDCEIGTRLKDEVDYADMPSENMYSRHMENVASSSGSNIRSSLIGMGFSPSLVNRAIEEKGEADVELLLETLFAYPDLHKSHSESSDSLDSLFRDDKDAACGASGGETVKMVMAAVDTNDGGCCAAVNKDEVHHQLGMEPDVRSGVDVDKKGSLLMMNFSLDEVDFAIKTLGEDTPITELVDFIFAAQLVENYEKDADDPNHRGEERIEDTETLFGNMDKTLCLLEMGFSEREISGAVEKYGLEVPITVLADSIVADQTGSTFIGANKCSSTSLSVSYSGSKYRSFGKGIEQGQTLPPSSSFTVKKEDYLPDAVSEFTDIEYKGKRPNEEYADEHSSVKRPKEEYDDDLNSSFGPAWLESRQGISKHSNSQLPVPKRKCNLVIDGYGMPKLAKPNSCRSVDQRVAKPPYFLYGNVMNLSHDSWVKISQFLYAIEPEFANTQFFSALSRKEGYIHNLPTENRTHIFPKSPMTIEEAIPHSKRYWPSWDTRKQLSCISSEVSGIQQLCDRLGKTLTESKGLLSVERQRDLLHQCRTLNIVWVGQNKLAQIEPEHLERILGYPLHHTRASGFSLVERIQSLKHCFQTDTLGYHISVLRSLFPDGLTMLSIYSGVGGAEITLHRLGIRLKGIVSVEPSETKRKIIKQWWHDSAQKGELVQIEDIQRLSSNKLESLIRRFGGFDFIICQNPHVYSPQGSSTCTDKEDLAGLDFSLFYEFVRVLQRVRSTMERNR
ncbi:hypothetical protein RJ639_033397 [Escallonia herrerae]|uniref:SAM-dependent MTase DRM-type domain-containing protein n=1 Tax=Escallonia herrerae TaxID=1293975 RepID=A0AA89BLE1_9ASTE|nr:hypothetical protein RJ639_033397 [Escallonia herrerae]